jgi:CubicO group peptidase (beta-lactamase class C family)
MAVELTFVARTKHRRATPRPLLSYNLQEGQSTKLMLSRCNRILAFLTGIPFLYAQNPNALEGEHPIGPLLHQIESYVQEGMQKTGVPGLAVAVVYQDRVVYLKGFGVRKAGCRASVDADTVFQLASVSKPIASTVVAALVGTRQVDWNDRIVDLDPQFELSDPNVTKQLTIRDLISHRSGLPTSAGDALEDLGFSRPEILHKMRLLRLPGEFRKTYKYSNFGFTEGAIAAAKRVREQWEDLAKERLFKPLGMASTSYRYSDYENSENKAAIHVFVDGKAVARYKRDPDAEAPAGSASSSVRDLAQWLRLQLANGTWNGKQMVAAKAVEETHSPQIVTGPDHVNGGSSYYGLGWNVNYDRRGKLILSHSGAFFLGTGTAIRLSPSDQLGIAVLTNALPTGLAEAVTFTFFDLYQHGKATRDWLPLLADYFRSDIETDNNQSTDYSKLTAPPAPAPSKQLAAYVGTYRNDYYGQVEISEHRGSLWMRLPATGALYALTHWDGDTFTYRFEAEQGIGTRGVVFTLTSTPHVLIENLALEGDGVFTRKDQ